MLDSVRSSLLGRPHAAHSPFLEAGALSLTLQTHSPAQQNPNPAAIRDLIWVLEKVVRIHDQLDEQLHAGYFFYIFTTPAKFVSNTIFIWPCLLMVYGLCLPIWTDYCTLCEQPAGAIKGWEARKSALRYMACAYALGVAVYITPLLYIRAAFGGESNVCPQALGPLKE